MDIGSVGDWVQVVLAVIALAVTIITYLVPVDEAGEAWQKYRPVVRRIALFVLFVIAVVGAYQIGNRQTPVTNGGPEATREVDVTRIVTQEVVVTRMVEREVTRMVEVPVEATRLVTVEANGIEDAPQESTLSCDDPDDIELLAAPWELSASGGNADEPNPPYPEIEEGVFQGKDVLRVVLDLKGAELEEGSSKDESVIIIDQPPGHWMVASVATHGLVNGKDGRQTIYIPLSDFEGLGVDGPDGTRLDLNEPAGPLHARFWNEQDFDVDIFSIVACDSELGE